MQNKWLVLLVCLANALPVAGFGQEIHPGIGASLGYHSVQGGGGLLASLKYAEAIEVYGGTALARYQGSGWAAGLRFFPFRTSWQPFIGAGLNGFSSNFFGIGINPDRSEYESQQISYGLVQFGVAKRISISPGSGGAYLSALFYLSLRYSPVPQNDRIETLGGIQDAARTAKVNNAVADGVGAGMSVILYFAPRGRKACP